MTDRIKLEVLGRREFVLGAGAAALLVAILPGIEEAVAAETWQDTVKRLTGGATPTEGKVTLKLPEIAENRNTVPYTVLVDSPMTDKDYVKAVHVIATGNPTPLVVSFGLAPMTGKAKISSRMRMGKTQEIMVLAQMSDGKVMMGKKTVKVTIGGCGG